MIYAPELQVNDRAVVAGCLLPRLALEGRVVVEEGMDRFDGRNCNKSVSTTLRRSLITLAAVSGNGGGKGRVQSPSTVVVHSPSQVKWRRYMD